MEINTTNTAATFSHLNVNESLKRSYLLNLSRNPPSSIILEVYYCMYNSLPFDPLLS